MEIIYHENFRKNFKKRVSPNKKLVTRFQERLELLIDNPDNPQLKNHKLIGTKKELNAFSVTGDIRVVYKIENSKLLLYDIGTRNQVY